MLISGYRVQKEFGPALRFALLTTASQARQRSTGCIPLIFWRNWEQKAGGCAVSIKLSGAIHEFPFRGAGP
jgi:hypothetical protein